jgi:hypothetical protein
MPKVLTRLRIDEVSAVDRGAGDGVKIVLMKRDDTPRSKPHVERHARRLRKFQEMFDSPERDQRRSFNEIIGKVADGNDDGGGNSGGGASDHHASKVADLLVEAGSHPDRASALSHLLHKPSGQALLARMHKAADQTEKELSNMRTSETLESIMKAGSIAGVCAAIVAKGSTTFTEEELVKAISRVAAGASPGVSPDIAFAKLYEGDVTVRKAVDIAKAWPSPASLVPTVVVGPNATHEAIDNTAGSEAYQQLVALAERQRRDGETASAAFMRIYLDPANRHLAEAERAANRPRPTTIFPMPGSAPPGRDAYAKSDPVPTADSAYAALMRKAEEYRSAHPELSVAQCFEKIYTDRGNIYGSELRLTA